eukprot:292790-Prorocentrum_minimum.AAC.1
MTSFYGASCANNGKGALNTPEALRNKTNHSGGKYQTQREESRSPGLLTRGPHGQFLSSLRKRFFSCVFFARHTCCYRRDATRKFGTAGVRVRDRGCAGTGPRACGYGSPGVR